MKEGPFITLHAHLKKNSSENVCFPRSIFLLWNFDLRERMLNLEKIQSINSKQNCLDLKTLGTGELIIDKWILNRLTQLCKEKTLQHYKSTSLIIAKLLYRSLILTSPTQNEYDICTTYQ